MAFEVEIKAQISESQLARLARELADSPAGLSEPIRQADAIFVPAPLRLREVDGALTPILRVRVDKDGRALLTLKQDRSDQLDSVELEVDISSPSEMEQILNRMGFHSVVRVVKARRKASAYGLSINLDVVDHLGQFVECEKMLGPEDDVDACRREMWGVLANWGISEAQAVHQGYDRLLDAAGQ